MNPRSSCLLVVTLLLAIQQPHAQQSTTGPQPPPQMPMGRMSATGTQVTIAGVPSYLWHHGCGPTAVGMVVGYYDGNGFADLVAGDASTQTDAVNTMIASTEHYNDYSLPLDYAPNLLPDKSSLGGAHSSNCVADFMNTSWSSRYNYYGWSWSSDIGSSFGKYVALVNATYIVSTADFYYSTGSWAQYTQEIDAHRPVVLLVDSDGDGATDHFVTGIGYDQADSTYGVYNTWDTQVHWYPWHGMKSGSPWGIFDFTRFTLSPPNNWIVVSQSSLPDFGSVIVGTSSASQSYDVSASNLIDDVELTASPGFELSLDNSTFGNPFSLAKNQAGVISLTPVFVRFSPGAIGSQTGTIAHTSMGASTRYVRLSGTGLSDLRIAVGDTVRVILTTDCVNARSVPSITGSTIFKCEPAGMKGVVLAGPSNDVNGSSQIRFFQVHYADGIQGWSDSSYLDKSPGPLPIQMISFTFASGSLEWTTVSETNNFGFFVQKDGLDIPDAFIPGHGTTTETHHYSYRPLTDGTFRLRQVDLDGRSHFTEPVRVVLGIDRPAPQAFELLQSWPNPCNPGTTIRFGLPRASNVKIAVFNALGEHIAMLADGVFGAGYHEVKFDGAAVASGVYFYRLQAGCFVNTKKFALLK